MSRASPALLFAALLALAPPFAAVGQPDAVREAVYTGRVTDHETGAPLPGVHVFEAASLNGTVTGPDGRFRLAVVPGPFRLYVTMIGYEPVRRQLEPAPGARDTLDVRLRPAVLTAPTLTVEAERDRRWPRRYERFVRLFVGTSSNADSVRIPNAGALDFDGGWGRLTAHASEPLVLENRALGYRVTYFLREFEARGGTIRYDGEPLFEPLPPADFAEAEEWRTARAAAYDGSLRHFLRALMRGRAEEEGFVVYRRQEGYGGALTGGRFPLPADRLLDVRADGAYLDFSGVVEVQYVREPADPRFARYMTGTGIRGGDLQISFIELGDGPTRLDPSGEVIDPYGLTVSGHFAYEGMAEALPSDYVPRGRR